MAEVFRQEDIEVDTVDALPLTISRGAISFNTLCFTLRSLRTQLSMVPQQPDLFHRSIRDNITLGADISEESKRGFSG